MTLAIKNGQTGETIYKKSDDIQRLVSHFAIDVKKRALPSLLPPFPPLACHCMRHDRGA